VQGEGEAALDDDQMQSGSDSTEIAFIACDHGLPGSLRAHHDVSVDDISRPGSRQQETNGRGIRSVERNQVGVGLANQPRETGLPGRAAHRLSEGGRWNCDAHASVHCSCKQCEDLAIVPVQRDEAASVERDTAHAALPFPERFEPGARTESAQALSSFVRGPPVCWRASWSISRQPAASCRATSTACWTKAETLDAVPAATSERISRTCACSRVMVILAVAIPKTIPHRAADGVLAWYKRSPPT